MVVLFVLNRVYTYTLNLFLNEFTCLNLLVVKDSMIHSRFSVLKIIHSIIQIYIISE